MGRAPFIKTRPYALALTLILGIFIVITPTPAASEESAEIPFGSLPLSSDILKFSSKALNLTKDLKTQDPVRVALVSTGVDVSVLPESLRSQIDTLGTAGDGVGYGTQAASAILQVAPASRITSISMFSANGSFRPESPPYVMKYVLSHVSEFDVVLYAVPPRVFLDPITAAMAAGTWGQVSEAMSSWGLTGSRGQVFGVPTSDHLFDQLVRGTPHKDRHSLWTFQVLMNRWRQTTYLIEKIVQSGVSVVVPAGDLGTSMQTVMGIANLRSVITVGAHDGSGVAETSSSGPAIDGSVKPDLVAPSNIATLLPESSQLANLLGGSGLLDPNLTLSWDAGEPLTDARTRTTSTVTSAAFVAAAVGSLSLQGVESIDAQRGALMAASLPVRGGAPYRQGAGLLTFMPDSALAASRPLVGDDANLGAEPEGGTWSTTIPVIRGKAQSARTTISDFVGVTPQGKNYSRSTASSPSVGASISESGVKLSIPLGNNSYEGGLYCGYTEVAVPTTGSTADPRFSIYGIPPGSEQVPTCFVEGTRLDAFGFYIHDMPAENLTFGLFPSMPVGSNILDRPMTLLPIDPTQAKLFTKVTGADGYARFSNVPPGYYKIRQWSDYGTPAVQTVTDSKTGASTTQQRELGSDLGYQAFEGLILSSLCSDQIKDAFSCELGISCSEDYLKQTFGAENVEHDKPTGGWFVGPRSQGNQRLRVFFGFMKKMPGSAVTSRYVDLVKYDDLSFFSLPLSDVVRVSQLSAVTSQLGSWSFGPGQDPEDLTAVSNPVIQTLGGNDSRLGIAKYPFAMTTPNYSARMSLNFNYSLNNAVIFVIVEVGNDSAVGIVNPAGTFQLPNGSPNTGLDLDAYEVWGKSSGEATFDFKLFPRGASEGNVWFIFSPFVGGPVASATIGDLSLELSTWMPANWPATRFASADYGQEIPGHVFRVNARYSKRQMSDPECREVDNGQSKATVCEDWSLFVHNPKHDASTFDVWSPSTGSSVAERLRASGAMFFDPQRTTTDFTYVIAFSSGAVADVDASLTFVNALKTNGRFWEELVIPRAFLETYEGELEFRIADNVSGSQSSLLPHSTGAAPISPYLPFSTSARIVDWVAA